MTTPQVPGQSDPNFQNSYAAGPTDMFVETGAEDRNQEKPWPKVFVIATAVAILIFLGFSALTCFVR